MRFVILLIATILLITLYVDPTKAGSRVRRQGWTWGNENENGNGNEEINSGSENGELENPDSIDSNFGRPDRRPRPTRPRPTRPRPTVAPTVAPTAAPTVTDANQGTTTVNPELDACLRRCATTPQYNPVCGTNRRTYDNEQRLKCAKRCGVDVEVSFLGTCGS